MLLCEHIRFNLDWWHDKSSMVVKAVQNSIELDIKSEPMPKWRAHGPLFIRFGSTQNWILCLKT